ncbi:GtrA family protein [bacterium]|nr:GtrA family protein [bacterium]MBP3847997.1 GtrA family protein [bacterium]
MIMEMWLKLPDFIRFIIIGGINAAISYIIYAICVLIFGTGHYQLCVALQWILSSFISYLNQKFFVFCTRGNYVKEYLKCCSTWAISYVLNVIILEIFVRFLIKNVYIAQFISLFLVSISTYILFKFFAFKKTE